MKIALLQVGKTKDRYIEEGIAEFVKRLRAFCGLEIITLRDSSVGSKPRAKIIEEESTAIVDKLSSFRDYKKILLDIKGKSLSSEDLADLIKQIRDFEGGKLLLIIGGAYGVDDALRNAVDFRLSLSPLTFTHQLTRLILLEQLYRAFTIIAGKEYHY